MQEKEVGLHGGVLVSSMDETCCGMKGCGRSGMVSPFGLSNIVVPTTDPELRVATWIEPTEGNWREDLVRHAVEQDEAPNVLAMSTLMLPRENFLIWPFTKDRRISAMSAYHRLCEREDNHADGSGAGTSRTSPIWRKCGKLIPC